MVKAGRQLRKRYFFSRHLLPPSVTNFTFNFHSRKAFVRAHGSSSDFTKKSALANGSSTLDHLDQAQRQKVLLAQDLTTKLASSEKEVEGLKEKLASSQKRLSRKATTPPPTPSLNLDEAALTRLAKKIKFDVPAAKISAAQLQKISDLAAPANDARFLALGTKFEGSHNKLSAQMEKFVQGTGVGQGDGRFKTMAETLVKENSARLDSVLQTSMANAHQVQLATIAADAKNPLNIDFRTAAAPTPKPSVPLTVQDIIAKYDESLTLTGLLFKKSEALEFVSGIAKLGERSKVRNAILQAKPEWSEAFL
jgi:hypothetical protein